MGQVYQGDLYYIAPAVSDPVSGAFGEARYANGGPVITGWSNAAAGGFPVMVLRRARGVPGAELAVQANDVLGSISIRGHDGGVDFTGTQGSFAIRASENWTPAAHGTQWGFFITALGGLAQVESMRIDGSVTADDIRTLVFDVTAAALKRISRGVADSGGVGFRVLRIPN